MSKNKVNRTFFTSESITEGHPDKVCDQIADYILDSLLEQDPESRCACEVTAEPGAVHIMGEITTKAEVDYKECARKVIRKIGYTKPEYGFDDNCEITVSIHQQSPDIAMGVDCSLETRVEGNKELGAGDQGMMFGYACKETGTYMPLAIDLAHKLTKGLAWLRKSGTLPYLRPDGKSQVTVEYIDGKAERIDTIVVSTQHDPDVDMEQLHKDMEEELIKKIIPAFLMDDQTKILINPTGRFVLGGPAADTGLTGRKIIADTYGGYARHGGGAFSGKDATKVDRSAAYMARYVAKHVVAAGLAEKCEIQLSYAIGVAKPVSVFIETFGTENVNRDEIEAWVEKHFDMRPAAIISLFDLRKPIYSDASVYGHFGTRDKQRKWEQLDQDIIESAKELLGQLA